MQAYLLSVQKWSLLLRTASTGNLAFRMLVNSFLGQTKHVADFMKVPQSVNNRRHGSMLPDLDVGDKDLL